jgi:mRNA deadenylase 3'-5' endonuclease subunit Ccr4
MPKLTEQQLRERAKMAAVESAPVNGVGDFLTQIEEEENVYTFLFAAKMKGYVGWTWSVSLFADDENTTVSEVNLMPGDESLVAPNWVPWAERLADYKALQAELEAAAAEESEDEESADDEIDDEQSDENEEVVELVTEQADESVEAEEVLATTLANESPDAEQDSDDAGGRVPRFLRRRLGRLKYKK